MCVRKGFGKELYGKKDGKWRMENWSERSSSGDFLFVAQIEGERRKRAGSYGNLMVTGSVSSISAKMTRGRRFFFSFFFKLLLST